MSYYFNNEFVIKAINSNDIKIDSFSEAITKYIEYSKSIYGNRKKVIPISIVSKDIKFSIEANRFDHPGSILRKILIELGSKYRVCRHNNLNRINHFDQLLKKISGYKFEENSIIIEYKEDDQTRIKEFINEMWYFISDCLDKKQHIEKINPDFTNYMDKYPNVDVDIENINNYIDILIKYSDVIDLPEFINIGMRYRYSVDYGTTYRKVEGDIHSIKNKLFELINVAYKYSTDIVDIYPSEIAHLDLNNYNKIDFLTFSTMENDNAIAVHKYLDEERGKAISAYYAEKPSGSYVGD